MTRPPASRGIRIFAIIWFGQFLSLVGSGLTSFGLGVWVFQTTGSITQYTLNAFFIVLPNIILLPVAGAMVDRWGRRRAMILSNCGAAFTSLVAAMLLLAGRLEIWQVYLISFSRSCFSTFQIPAYSSLPTLLIPKRHFGRASGMVQSAQATAQIISPLLASALIVTIHIQGLILLDFVSFLLALGVLTVMRIPEYERPIEDDMGRGSLIREAFDGWVYIRGRSGLLALLFYSAAVNLTVGASQALFTPMVLSIASPQALGKVLSYGGIGLLTGSVVMSIWGGPKRRVLGILGSGLLLGLSVMLAGLRPSIPLIAAGLFGMLFVVPILNGCAQAIWQSKTPPDLQGRVFAIRRMISWSTTPLAFLVAGPLADRIFEPLLVVDGPLSESIGRIIGVGPGRGIGLMFIASGFLSLLAPVITYLYPRVRCVEDELPDVVADKSLARA